MFEAIAAILGSSNVETSSAAPAVSICCIGIRLCFFMNFLH